ncbi:hypothetical protein [Ideonella sp. B508-1]|uniref:hypothetical protein n=1 Tax=Ideonella sp. B508-1 TaxID=137716 RepID=UPI00034B90BE|nr:hypothetical protein [Ideonella sp. B508-1]
MSAAQDGVPDAAAGPVTPRQQALARLAASRARLRAQALPDAAADAAGGGGRGLRPWWRLLRRELGRTPLGLAAMAWVERWWQRQPLAAAAQQGAEEFRTAVLPVVRRHPLAALAGAALLGGALVASRRWWWGWAGRRAGHWRGSLGAWVWRQASDPAVQLLLLGWIQQFSAARAAASAAPEPPVAPDSAAPVEPAG